MRRGKVSCAAAAPLCAGAARILAVLLIAAAGLAPAHLSAAQSIVVGSKAFTEGYVLGEIAAQAIEASGQGPVTRKLGMGSTGIVFEALKSRSIDVDSDYTRSEEHTSELQSPDHLVCRLLLEK